MITCQFFYFAIYFSSHKQQIVFSGESLLKDTLHALIMIFLLANLYFLFYEGPIQKILRQLIFGVRLGTQASKDKSKGNDLKTTSFSYSNDKHDTNNNSKELPFDQLKK